MKQLVFNPSPISITTMDISTKEQAEEWIQKGFFLTESLLKQLCIVFTSVKIIFKKQNGNTEIGEDIEAEKALILLSIGPKIRFEKGWIYPSELIRLVTTKKITITFVID